jgi:RNA polymerase sigma-B factor
MSAQPNATAHAPAATRWDPRNEVRTQRLFRRLRRFGDASAREQLIQLYMPLARRLAWRHTGTREPFDDMLQVAVVGLILAVDRFDPERGIPFAAYAKPTIAGELKRHLRDHAWSVHVPRELQDRALRVASAAESHSGAAGVAGTLEHVAERSGMSVEEAAEAMKAWSGYAPDSLDGPDSASQLPGAPVSAGADDPGYAVVENLSVIERALAALRPNERAVIALRFGADLNQSEIAARVGVSQMHVSRLLARAMERLEVVARQNG